MIRIVAALDIVIALMPRQASVLPQILSRFDRGGDCPHPRNPIARRHRIPP